MPHRGPARTGAQPLAWSAPGAAAARRVAPHLRPSGRLPAAVALIGTGCANAPVDIGDGGGFTAIMLTARQNIPLPPDQDAASYADTVIILQDGRIA